MPNRQENLAQMEHSPTAASPLVGVQPVILIQGSCRGLHHPGQLDLIGQREGRVDVDDVAFEHVTARGLGSKAFLILGVVSQHVQGVEQPLTTSW